MKIGIYGGTFNPPHLGHLTAAAAVVSMLKLDKLLLIPASIPPHKALPAGSPTAEQRLEMTRLAGEQLGLGDRVETLDMELRRQGKSYTSDTLAALKAQYPEDELWLLMGTDMFLSFQTWHEPEKIASLAGIAAFGRQIHGFDREDAVLCGVESRTSSPVRILRDENKESAIRGLFPCGEGAGYAGGITSAAVDGIRIAQELAARFARPVRH